MRDTLRFKSGAVLETDVLLAAVEESQVGMSDIGFCLACGEESYGVEPDARRYECESCGERKVYGAEEILLMVGW
jgi:hypothetical protein